MTPAPSSSPQGSKTARHVLQYRLRFLVGVIALVAINCGMVVVVSRQVPTPWLLVLFGTGLVSIAVVLVSAARAVAARGVGLGFAAGLIAITIAIAIRGYMPILLLTGGPKPENEIHSFATTVLGAGLIAAGFALIVGIAFGIVKAFINGHRASGIVVVALVVWWLILWEVAISVRTIGRMGPGHRAWYPYERIER